MPCWAWPTGAPMAARTGRRALAVVLAIVLLLAVAAVLDEVARRMVERQTAVQLQQRFATSQPFGVHIGGWPFTALLVTGSAQSVSVTTPRFQLKPDGGAITVTDVEIVGHHVRDVRRPMDAVARTLDVYATVSWAEVSERGGATITSSGGGRASFTGTVDLLGARVKVSVSAVPQIDPSTHRLVLSQPRATLAGVELPPAALLSVADSLAGRITLPAPKGFTYESVEATSSGLRVHLTGTDVKLAALG